MLQIEPKLKGFKVYHQTNGSEQLKDYHRADLYKICLFSGKGTIFFKGKKINIDGHLLFFGKPHFFDEFDAGALSFHAYSCIFTHDFVRDKLFMTDQEEKYLFGERHAPVFSLTTEQSLKVTLVFKEMIYELNHHYRYRADLIGNYVRLLVLEALNPRCFDKIFYKSNHKGTVI